MAVMTHYNILCYFPTEKMDGITAFKDTRMLISVKVPLLAVIYSPPPPQPPTPPTVTRSASIFFRTSTTWSRPLSCLNKTEGFLLIRQPILSRKRSTSNNEELPAVSNWCSVDGLLNAEEQLLHKQR
uniref:Uncharacterized protein n=1 Tax=Solanum tuberosum TaxID=4113 RepID=M1B6Z8_SOLTU